MRKAKEDATVWLNLHGILPSSHIAPPASSNAYATSAMWSKPPNTFLKCNIGSAWSSSSTVSGAGWIIRNPSGKVLYHSRRSFSGVTSNIQASVLAVSWASAAVVDLKLKNVLFEFSSVETANVLQQPVVFPSLYHICYEIFSNTFSLPRSSLHLVPVSCNHAASSIADSVVRDQRLQSYVATGGPQWLSLLLEKEATG